MNLSILVLIICFFVFLYVLYYLSRDDFVIIRKDIQMEKIFNMAILTGLVSLFFSRLFFVLFNPKPELINPLGFLAIPYYPGLSLIGGILGGSLFIYLYAKTKKMPVGKVFDLFVISFICAQAVGFLLTFIVLFGKTSLMFNILMIVSIIVFIIFTRFVYTSSIKGEIKDATLGLVYLAIFSLIYFLTKLFLNIKDFSFMDAENITVLVVLFTSLILLVNQEIMDKFLEKK